MGQGLKSIRAVGGSLVHLWAATGLRRKHLCTFLAIFRPSLAPPANLVKFLWYKMTCHGVQHIVLHVLCWTHTSGGYWGPLKSVLTPFQATLFFKAKTHFLRKDNWLKICVWSGLPNTSLTCIQKLANRDFRVQKYHKYINTLSSLSSQIGSPNLIVIGKIPTSSSS